METVLLFKDLENFRRLVSLIPNNFGRLILYSYSVFVTQSCLTLCNAMDCISPGSSVHGILQARIMEWVAIPFSRGSSQPRDQTSISCLLHRQSGSLPPAPHGRPKDLRAKTVKLSKENIGINLCDSALENSFLDIILKTQATKDNNI